MKPEIGKEYPPENEDLYIRQMLDQLRRQMDELWPTGTRMLRQAETKMHGCLKAKLIVEPNLPPEHRVGIFAEPKTYDTIVRYSNAKTGLLSDSTKDLRGMSLKVVGVPGEKLLEEAHRAITQDFITLNYETFVSRNVKEFSRIIHAFTSGKLALLLYALNPMNWRLLMNYAKASTRIGSLVEEDYYSTTPYQFGHQKAVKYKFKSQQRKETDTPSNPDPNYLRKDLVSKLEDQDVYFDFMVQFQEDPESMPIEDPSIPWESEFHKLATIHIPAQQFDTPENNYFGECLSFNPWHSLPAHRPLGGLNRARLAIYTQLADYRHLKNGIRSFEPTDMSFTVPSEEITPEEDD